MNASIPSAVPRGPSGRRNTAARPRPPRTTASAARGAGTPRRDEIEATEAGTSSRVGGAAARPGCGPPSTRSSRAPARVTAVTAGPAQSPGDERRPDDDERRRSWWPGRSRDGRVDGREPRGIRRIGRVAARSAPPALTRRARAGRSHPHVRPLHEPTVAPVAGRRPGTGSACSRGGSCTTARRPGSSGCSAAVPPPVARSRGRAPGRARCPPTEPRTNRSNASGSSAGGMPGPSSSTVSRSPCASISSRDLHGARRRRAPLTGVARPGCPRGGRSRRRRSAPAARRPLTSVLWSRSMAGAREPGAPAVERGEHRVLELASPRAGMGRAPSSSRESSSRFVARSPSRSLSTTELVEALRARVPPGEVHRGPQVRDRGPQLVRRVRDHPPLVRGGGAGVGRRGRSGWSRASTSSSPPGGTGSSSSGPSAAARARIRSTGRSAPRASSVEAAVNAAKQREPGDEQHQVDLGPLGGVRRSCPGRPTPSTCRSGRSTCRRTTTNSAEAVPTVATGCRPRAGRARPPASCRWARTRPGARTATSTPVDGASGRSRAPGAQVGEVRRDVGGREAPVGVGERRGDLRPGDQQRDEQHDRGRGGGTDHELAPETEAASSRPRRAGSRRRARSR